MKRIAFAALVLLAVSCASSDSLGDLGEKRALPCEHGPIEVRVGMSGFGIGGAREVMDDRLTLSVEVANNSREDVVVKAIRTEQTHVENAPYRFGDGYATFNETIAENGQHVFEVPLSGRAVMQDPNVQNLSNDLGVAVSVYLASGETYRCVFRIPGRR